jgi:hypothetical protein
MAKKVFKSWDEAQRSQVASANAMGNLVGDIDEAHRIADMYTEDWVEEIGAKVLESRNPHNHKWRKTMPRKSKDDIITELEDRIDELETENDELKATLDDITDLATGAAEEEDEEEEDEDDEEGKAA